MFTNAAEIKTFALAGNATLTLTSQKTEKHFTFKIRQLVDRETSERKDLWFVSVLTGPDNTSDYQYIGAIYPDGFRRTAKSRLPEDAPSVRGFGFFWKYVAQDAVPPQMRVQHAGSCGRCGRKLTHPTSLDNGIGPECLNQMGG